MKIVSTRAKSKAAACFSWNIFYQLRCLVQFCIVIFIFRPLDKAIPLRIRKDDYTKYDIPSNLRVAIGITFFIT